MVDWGTAPIPPGARGVFLSASPLNSTSTTTSVKAPNSTGVFTGGAAPAASGSVDLNGSGIDLHSGDPFNVTLAYSNGTLTETLVDASTGASFTKSYAVDIPTIVGGRTAYFGFTGGSGGLSAVQDISSWTFTPVTPPATGAPSGLSATAASQNVSLSWTATAGAASYNIYRGTGRGAEGTTPIASGVTATGFTDTTVTNGTTYYYVVAAVNAGGTGARSAEVSALPQIAPPAPPTGVTATAASQSVALAWAVTSTATSYSVFRGTASNAQSTTPIATGITGTTFNDTTVTNGVNYFYKIVALNAGGGGAASAEVSARPVFVAHVNFSNSTTQTSAGYINDTGLIFATRSNGQSFGWNRDNTLNARNRNAFNSPDELHDSFNVVQASTFIWELAVPAGQYSVHIIAGDPSAVDGAYTLDAEAVAAIRGTPSTLSRWLEATVTVTVTDGRLTITSVGTNKIDSIDVTTLALAAPAIVTAAATATPTATPTPTVTPALVTATPTATSSSTSSTTSVLGTTKPVLA